MDALRAWELASFAREERRQDELEAMSGDEHYCSLCGRVIRDEQDEYFDRCDDTYQHMACSDRSKAADDLREKIESVLDDLADALKEHEWEINYGPSKGGAVPSDEKSLIDTIERGIAALALQKKGENK